MFFAGIPLLAFALSAGTLPVSRRLGLRFGIVARRANSDTHDLVPVFGGASIVFAMLATLAVFRALPAWMLFSTAALWLVGVIDDAHELRPRQKLAGQIVVAIVVVWMLPRFAFTPWPAVDFCLAGFWMLAICNAFNLIDGLDGLAAGTGIVASLAMASTGLLLGNAPLATAGLAVAGALSGFLLFNFHPASIFMGDSGALSIGLVLGALALEGATLPHNSHVTKYAYPILIMMMPLLDTGIVSVTRIATGNAISRHGLDHSHNRLLALGMTERGTVALSWTVGAIGALCAVAASLLPHPYLLTTLPFVALGAAILALFMMDLTFDSDPPGLAYGYAQGVARFILSFGYKRRVVEAAVDLALISGAYLGANLLRRNLLIDDATIRMLTWSLPGVLLATYAAFLMTGVYRGIWRYTGLSDGIRFANASVLAGVFMVPVSIVMPVSVSGSVLVLYVILLFNLLVLTRSSFQTIRRAIAYLALPTERILVVGAERNGTAAAAYLFSERQRRLRLIGFVDDDAFKQGKIVHGQRVLGTCADLERIYRNLPFDQVLIATDSISEDRVERIRAFGIAHNVSVRRFMIELSNMHDGDSPSAATAASNEPDFMRPSPRHAN